MLEVDYVVACPYCWQSNHLRLDLTGGDQRYVQDCEHCCNPMEVAFHVRDGDVEDVQVEPAQ